jgi:DNA-binding Lrp family transcriptional regulator
MTTTPTTPDSPLDTLDRKILWLLDRDGRASINAIAKTLRRSQQLISYRVNRLRQRGFIKNGITLINFHLIGTWSFRLYLRLRHIETNDEQALCSHLQKRPDVLWFVQLSGDWDYEVVFRLKSYVAFASVWKEIQSKFGSFYERVDISMTTVTYHFGRDYLVAKQRDTFAIAQFGNVNEIVPLSQIDQDILSYLARDCRISTSALQKKLRCGHTKLQERLHFLESQGVIQGYRVPPNVALLGRHYIKVLMKLNFESAESEDALYRFIARYPQVTYLSEVLGSWQFEIECEVVEQNEVMDMLRSVRRSFPQLVKDYALVEVTKEFVLNYGAKNTKELVA